MSVRKQFHWLCFADWTTISSFVRSTFRFLHNSSAHCFPVPSLSQLPRWISICLMFLLIDRHPVIDDLKLQPASFVLVDKHFANIGRSVVILSLQFVSFFASLIFFRFVEDWDHRFSEPFSVRSQITLC